MLGVLVGVVAAGVVVGCVVLIARGRAMSAGYWNSVMEDDGI